MEENKPLVTETEYPESDTDIISGDGTPIIDTSDQNTNAAKEESNTSESDAEENTEDSSTTNTEENGVEENTATEVTTDPANDPATLESALLVSTYAALNKLAEYVPTEYVNNSEPDINAEHLNNTEQGLLRVTNLLNGAVDVINDLQTTVAKQASAIDTLNSNVTDLTSANRINVTVKAETNSLNSPERTGVYYVTGENIGALPSGFSNYGILFCMRSPYTVHSTNTNAVYVQIYIDVYNKRATRAFNNGKWTNWSTF